MTQPKQDSHIAFQAIASSLNGVILTDIDGRITYANPAFVAMFKYDGLRAVLGRDAAELFADTNLRSLADVEQRMPDAIWEPEELVSRHKNGTEFPVMVTCTTVRDEAGKTIGRMASFVDISALKHAQRKLEDREQRYRELVETANSIIMRISPEYRITFFNKYAQAFFGYSGEEIVGKNVIGTILPQTDSEGRDLEGVLKETTAHPEAHGINDSEATCKDGKRVWVHWSNRAILDGQGQIKEIMCVGTDITERHRLKREATLYRRRLRQLATRLATAEEQERHRIATHIHDTVIQTLSLGNVRLGGIRAAVDAAGLAAEREKIEKVRTLLESGIAECRGLMSDLTPPLLYEVGLGTALQSLADKKQRLFGQIITVEADNQLNILDNARRGLLFQSARELVMNALKHAGECRIGIRVVRVGAEAIVEVHDTGKGFNPAVENLFEAGDEGGFGLFNIRERVHGLGGRLEIESAPGQGTTARVAVPVGAGLGDPAGARPPPHSGLDS